MSSDAATLLNNAQVLVGLLVPLVAGMVVRVPWMQNNRKWLLPALAQVSTWIVGMVQGHTGALPTEHTLAAGVMSAGLFSVGKNILQHIAQAVPVVQSILTLLGITKPAPKP